MRRCIVCDYPMSLNTQMERVETECRSSTCANQPCIHGWLENQNQNLCPVCKSVVGGNRSIPILESANNTADYRNNVVPPAAQRTEASGTCTDFLFNLELHWIFVTIVIIILAASCVMFFMF